MTNHRPVRRQLFVGALALGLAAVLLAAWWIVVDPLRPAAAHPPSPPAIVETPVIPPGMSKDQFYRKDLAPLLEKTKQRNLVCADQAVMRLHEEFNRFRSGIPEFVDDVASLRTRWGVVRRLTGDKWANFWKASDDPASEDVKKFMLDKFQAHIMSEDAIHQSVQAAVAQFKDDVTANRNQFLLEAKVALTTRDVRLEFPQPDLRAFQKAFDESVSQSVQVQAKNSLVNQVVALVGSGVAGAAGEQVVAYLIDLMGTEAVAAGVEAAAVGGSSTASGGAIGGASGWLGGPMGAVIGVGAGLAVGAAVDWWVTDRFKANLTEELTTYLNNLERDMIENTPATDGHGARIGLREAFRHAAEKLHDVQGEAVLKALAEAN